MQIATIYLRLLTVIQVLAVLAKRVTIMDASLWRSLNAQTLVQIISAPLALLTQTAIIFHQLSTVTVEHVDYVAQVPMLDAILYLLPNVRHLMVQRSLVLLVPSTQTVPTFSLLHSVKEALVLPARPVMTLAVIHLPHNLSASQ
mgnify:CR=1 FL=1